MRFISAYQELDKMVADVERLLQNKEIDRKDILLICLESRRSEISRMLDIPMETVKDDSDEAQNPLDKYDLTESSYDLYDNLILTGGYVLLGRKDKIDDTVLDSTGGSEERHSTMHASGFGVNMDVPDSDETNHEDNFNPDNPNPQADR